MYQRSDFPLFSNPSHTHPAPTLTSPDPLGYLPDLASSPLTCSCCNSLPSSPPLPSPFHPTSTTTTNPSLSLPIALNPLTKLLALYHLTISIT